MTTIFFAFLRDEEQKALSRTARWVACGAVVGWWLLACASTGTAGLIPTSKDRAQGNALSQQANTAYQSGDLAGALKLLEQADALKPDQADAWNLRGVILLKQRAYDKAEAAFSRAVAIDPSLWAAQFNLAEAAFQKKDWARAQGRFDRLLAQTDRFKAANKWELVAYKSFLCALLVRGEAGAGKELGRLPATGGTTPASQYAQAALAYNRKDAGAAARIVSGARTTYPAVANDLFASSLETAGWQAPAPSSQLPTPGSPAINVDPETAAAMNAAGLTNPNNLPAAARSSAATRPAVVIDPRLVAASSDPLPAGAGRDIMPVNGPAAKSTGTRRSAKEKTAPETPATPAAANVAPVQPEVTPPQSPLEHEGLLLGLD